MPKKTSSKKSHDEKKPLKTSHHTVRVNGTLKQVTTLYDSTGEILHQLMSPIMIEFYPRDIMQVVVGASLLAIPLAYTEETWKLGESLPMENIYGLMILSALFISLFVYYNYYRGKIKNHWGEFLKRVISTYLISFFVVGLVLYLIERAPFGVDPLLAFKRVVIVAFPASMSAAVADMIK